MFKKMIAGAVLAAGAALVVAPIASADEASYISDLEQSGYGFNGQKATYVNIGYQVCNGAARGENQNQLIADVVANTGAGIYSQQAQFIVESAEMYLC